MANYIDQTYDYDKIERIYLSGDGAGCIKTGTGVINKSTLQGGEGCKGTYREWRKGAVASNQIRRQRIFKGRI